MYSETNGSATLGGTFRDYRSSYDSPSERSGYLCDGQQEEAPLSYAAEHGHEAVVKRLLEKGADIETKSYSKSTPLSWAAQNGREAVVKLRPERGAAIEPKDHYGHTPVSWAAKAGHEAVAKLLLERGADIESKGHSGRTRRSRGLPITGTKTS